MVNFDFDDDDENMNANRPNAKIKTEDDTDDYFGCAIAKYPTSIVQEFSHIDCCLVERCHVHSYIVISRNMECFWIVRYSARKKIESEVPSK